MGTLLRFAPIRVEGSNIIIKVDEDDIEKEIMLYSYDVIRRVTY